MIPRRLRVVSIHGRQDVMNLSRIYKLRHTTLGSTSLDE